MSSGCPDGDNGPSGEGESGEHEKGDRVECCYQFTWNEGGTTNSCLSNDPMTDPQFDMPICKSDTQTPEQACASVLGCPANNTLTLDLPSWIFFPVGATKMISCNAAIPTIEEDNACSSALKPGPTDLTAKVGFTAALNNGASGLVSLTINGVARTPGFTMPVTFDRTSGSSCRLKLRTLTAKITTKPVYGSYTAESGFFFLPKSVSTSINCSTGAFSFPANAIKLNMDWRQKKNSTGVISHASTLLQNSTALTGTLNLTTNKITFNGTFSGTGGGSSASVALNTVEGNVSAL